MASTGKIEMPVSNQGSGHSCLTRVGFLWREKHPDASFFKGEVGILHLHLKESCRPSRGFTYWSRAEQHNVPKVGRSKEGRRVCPWYWSCHPKATQGDGFHPGRTQKRCP